MKTSAFQGWEWEGEGEGTNFTAKKYTEIVETNRI